MSDFPDTTREPLTTKDAYRLGRRYQREGQIDQARRIFQRILEADPRHSNAMYALGIIAFREGRLDAAEAFFRQAMEANPSDGRYPLNQGVVLQRKGDYEAAEACYRRSIALAPGNAVAHYSLGVALQHQERYVEAERAYRQALVLNPENTRAMGNLVIVLSLLKRLDEAQQLLSQRLASAADDPGLLLALGRLNIERNDFVAAEASLKRSVELREDPSALLSLATMLNQNNRRGEAESLVRRAIELTGKEPGALGILAQAHHFEPGDPMLEWLHRSLEGGELEPRQRTRLLFALAKAYDDMDLFQKAAGFAHAANRATLGGTPFDVERSVRRVEWTIDNYGRPDASETFAGKAPVPVFIVGQSRAGKTLVETLLATDRRVYAAGESKELGDFIDSFGKANAARHASARRQRLLDPGERAAFGIEFLRRLGVRAPAAGWVTCTLPGYYLLVGFIFATIPGARVIHCSRDPLDQCVEMYFRSYRAESMRYTCDEVTLATHYRAYQRLIGHWRSLYAGRMLEVPYERLVSDPAGMARQIFQYCGMDAPADASEWALTTNRVGRGKRYAPYLPSMVSALGQASDPA